MSGTILAGQPGRYKRVACGVKCHHAEFAPDLRLPSGYNLDHPPSGPVTPMTPRGLAILFVSLVPGPMPAASAADPPPLQQQLATEPVADLAKAARERGDAGRGAVLFFQPFLTCSRCHDPETGTQLGPDIAKAGKDATAEYLVESVLYPSKVVKKGYETVTVTTTDDRTVTGLVTAETADALTLTDPAANGKGVTVPKAEIARRTTGAQSLMPDGLANLLSDRQQFLDLAKYLIEVAEHGPVRARELRPARTAPVVAEYEKDIDHAGMIRVLDDKAFR